MGTAGSHRAAAALALRQDRGQMVHGHHRDAAGRREAQLRRGARAHRRRLALRCGPRHFHRGACVQLPQLPPLYAGRGAGMGERQHRALRRARHREVSTALRGEHRAEPCPDPCYGLERRAAAEPRRPDRGGICGECKFLPRLLWLWSALDARQQRRVGRE